MLVRLGVLRGERRLHSARLGAPKLHKVRDNDDRPDGDAVGARTKPHGKSRRLRTIFPVCVEQYFGDDRLRTVRTELQSTLFECFLRKYIESIKSCDLLAGAKVEDRTNKSQARIIRESEGLQCECEGYIHTGLPCAHMLCYARRNNMSYLPLIKQRWLKSNPKSTRSSTQDKSTTKNND